MWDNLSVALQLESLDTEIHRKGRLQGIVSALTLVKAGCTEIQKIASFFRLKELFHVAGEEVENSGTENLNEYELTKLAWRREAFEMGALEVMNLLKEGYLNPTDIVARITPKARMFFFYMDLSGNNFDFREYSSEEYKESPFNWGIETENLQKYIGK
jgi:hypothetical protein